MRKGPVSPFAFLAPDKPEFFCYGTRFAHLMGHSVINRVCEEFPMSTTTSISASHIMAATQQAKTGKQPCDSAQSSAFEQMIGSLTSGISAGIKVDGSCNEKGDSGVSAEKSADDFMSKILAALQILQETDTPPLRKPHHIPEAEQVQQTTPVVDNAAAPVDTPAAAV